MEPRVNKRPATRKRSRPEAWEASAQYVPDTAAPPPASYAWAVPVPHHKPTWAAHVVGALQASGHLPTRAGRAQEIHLNVWSDCSGINSEMFALREIGAQLLAMVGIAVRWVLYCTCDLDPKSRRFSEFNHDPMHVSDQMEHRNMEEGWYFCSKHGENHALPRNGVDMYVGTFPCSPWSRRGKRTGLKHPEAQATITGFTTIGFMRPAVFVLEIGEMPSSVALDGLTGKLKQALQAATVVYTLQVVRHLTPASSGYPTRRKRLFIIGWRADINATNAAQPLQCLLESPLRVEHTFLHFLRWERRVDWTRVGECPSREELSEIWASQCRCMLDPLERCLVHACKCGHCGDSGTECAWRGMFAEYIAKCEERDFISKKKGTMTYLQVMEMQGLRGPDNPRQRLLINLLALRPGAHPLNETLMLGDVSQNPPYCDVFMDGTTPVFTTSSRVWVFQMGEFLTTQHAAALMGLDLSTMKFSPDMGEAWFRQRLGLTVHVASFGLVLLAALVPPLQAIVGVD